METFLKVGYVIKIDYLILLAILSGVLYRLGGWGKGHKLFRRLGCPIVSLSALCGLMNFNWWAYLLTFGLSIGAVSSYWGIDEKKWGYWAHGLGLSLALLPIALVTKQFLGFGLRCLVLTSLMTVWSEYSSIDYIEEFGRGALIILTIPLLCL